MSGEQSSGAALRRGLAVYGDLAVMESDGFFRIGDEQRDVIVNDPGTLPRDVEEVLYENNKVQEVVVIGIRG